MYLSANGCRSNNDFAAYHFSNHDNLWTKTFEHKEELCESCIADT